MINKLNPMHLQFQIDREFYSIEKLPINVMVIYIVLIICLCMYEELNNLSIRF